MTGSGTSFARGFTLIETMYAVLIMTILVTLAAPSFNDLVRNQRVKSAAFDVYAGLTYARSEAINRNAPVDIIPAVVIDWAGGWSIKAADGTTLRTQSAISGINISGPLAGSVTYQMSGRLSGNIAPAFVLKSSQSNSVTARCVNVDLSGRPTIEVDTNNNPDDGCQ